MGESIINRSRGRRGWTRGFGALLLLLLWTGAAAAAPGDMDPVVQQQVAQAWAQLVGADARPTPEEAGRRLARDPDLAGDFIAYAQSRGTEPLNRSLPGGHTVASLMRDYAFTVHGAFLVAVEVVLNPQMGEALLSRLVEQGYGVTDDQGRRSRQFPPIAARRPPCPQCGLRSTQDYRVCPRCGYGDLQRQLEAGNLPPELLQAIEKRRASGVAGRRTP